MQDIFIACVDGLKGFPDGIEAVYPKAAVQLCIVHMVGNSLNFAPWKVQKEVAADLKCITSAATIDEAEIMLTQFEVKWDQNYQSIGLSWRRNWARITPVFDYPAKIRNVIYTNNVIESINVSLRKVTKTRSSFPTDEAVSKLFYLALNTSARNGRCHCGTGKERSTASQFSLKNGCRRVQRNAVYTKFRTPPT